MNDGNGVGGGGGGVGVGSLGGGGVLQGVKERMLWVEGGWINLVDENGEQTCDNKPLLLERLGIFRVKLQFIPAIIHNSLDKSAWFKNWRLSIKLLKN